MIRMNYPKQHPRYLISYVLAHRLIYCLALATGMIASISRIQAQTVVDVCGTDTIILSAGNYQYAPIQWQESYNLTDWINIPNAENTTYTFFPTETKYYRAKVVYSHCPPEYSEVSLVQMPPQADAGADRTVPGSMVTLTGNAEEGADGTWSVLNGAGGSFSNLNSPQSQFIMGTDTAYTLVYSLENTCGTDHDTVDVRFVQNTYVSNIVVVDTTDLFLSDSSQIAQGEYRIHFSTPIPTITDSTFLVGIVNDGFLRQVTSFTIEADTFTMQTAHATLEDIMVTGSLNAAQTFSVDTTTGKTSYGPQRLDHAPTRSELNTNPKFQTGEVFYYYPDERVEFIRSGITLGDKMKSSNNYLIDVNFNSALYALGGSSIMLNGHYKFEPNIIADMEFQGLTLNAANVGMYNGIIDQNYQVSLTAAASLNLVDHPFTLLSINKPVIMVIGGVPVYIIATLKLNGKVSANISGGLNITDNYTKTSTHSAYLEYLDQNWTYHYDESSEVDNDDSYSVTGNATQSFKIGPEFTFKIYNIVGPYVEAKLTENLSLCSDFNGNWSAGMNIGGHIKVGVKAEVPAWTIFDVYKIWAQDFYHLQLPYEVAIESGNNQNYALGNMLTYPVEVQISSNRGSSAPFATVHFSALNGGSVSNSTVTADVNGIAATNWTPGGSGQSQLQVNVVDCEGEPINNAPVVFQAYEAGNCVTSSLSVSIDQSGSTLSPIVHNGVSPYTYSTDGVNFNTSVPQISAIPGQGYTFYVRDGNNCTASESHYVPADACANSDLSLNVEVSGTSIILTAQGGTPPHLYSFDGGSYDSTNELNSVAQGAHDVSVMDSNGCISSTAVFVGSASQVPACNGLTTVTDIDGNVYSLAEIGNQCWIAENLRTTKFSNGDVIPNITGTSEWLNVSSAAWCWFDNDSQHEVPYGKIYNGYTIEDQREVCPLGWHSANNEDWGELVLFLDPGGDTTSVTGFPPTEIHSTIAGGMMKESGTEHWSAPNTDAVNSAGFTALGGGYRAHLSGTFTEFGDNGTFWSDVEFYGQGLPFAVATRWLKYDNGNIQVTNMNASGGAYIRCVKD